MCNYAEAYIIQCFHLRDKGWYQVYVYRLPLYKLIFVWMSVCLVLAELTRGHQIS